MTVKDVEFKKGAYFSAGDGVYFDKGNVVRGDRVHNPYQTAFHEFAHNIDYLIGNGAPISECWGNNVLYDTIKDDFSKLKGNKTNEQLISDLKKQKEENGWTLKDIGAVSDILQSMTGIPYPLGVGHEYNYYYSRYPNTEFFAETIDGAAANSKSYSLLQQFFPNSVNIVHKIIGGAIK